MRSAGALVAVVAPLLALAGCISPPPYVPPDGVERYKEAHLACMSMMYAARDVHGSPSWNLYGYCMRQKGYPPRADEPAPS
jgi:hypothetical protein